MFKRVHGERLAGGKAEFWTGLWSLPGVLVVGLWVYAAAFGPVTLERFQTTTQATSQTVNLALWSCYVEARVNTPVPVNYPPGSTHARPHAVVGVAWTLDHRGDEVMGSSSHSHFPLSGLGMPDSLWTPIRLANLGLYAGHSPPSPWRQSHTRYAGVPLPLLVLVFAGPWLAIRWKPWPWPRREANPNACPACGYDVRGLERGCPECGWSRQHTAAGRA